MSSLIESLRAIRRRRLAETQRKAAQSQIPQPRHKVKKSDEKLPDRIRALLRSLDRPVRSAYIIAALDSNNRLISDALSRMTKRGEVKFRPKNPGTKKPLVYWVEDRPDPDDHLE